ncbi:MAG: restriction endonuclease subunit M, partial [Bacteroidales bacterium]|nr:restriction endonuclease subunit M [Bacteroidales bacterium]
MDSSVIADEALLSILLLDRTRSTKRVTHNIIWATDNYISLGKQYDEAAEISISAISGKFANLIQPRVKKTKEEQQARARDKGEVFTPAWICNKQNNLVDNEWFGVSGLFNEETDTGWTT